MFELLIEFISNYIYGFIMMAKGQQIELYHHSKELVDKWIEIIKDSVILVDLKDDYIIAQMIGKGNFAKVHLCKRKADERTFALKSVEKTLIRKSKRNSVILFDANFIFRAQSYQKLISLETQIMNTSLSSTRFMRATNTFTWSLSTQKEASYLKESSRKVSIMKKMLQM